MPDYTKLYPIGDRVVIKPDPTPEKTSSGIYIVEQNKTKQGLGTIVAIGPGRSLDNGQRMSMQVQVGDRVGYNPYAVGEIEFDGKKLHKLHESEIDLIIRP